MVNKRFLSGWWLIKPLITWGPHHCPDEIRQRVPFCPASIHERCSTWRSWPLRNPWWSTTGLEYTPCSKKTIQVGAFPHKTDFTLTNEQWEPWWNVQKSWHDSNVLAQDCVFLKYHALPCSLHQAGSVPSETVQNGSHMISSTQQCNLLCIYHIYKWVFWCFLLFSHPEMGISARCQMKFSPTFPLAGEGAMHWLWPRLVPQPWQPIQKLGMGGPIHIYIYNII